MMALAQMVSLMLGAMMVPVVDPAPVRTLAVPIPPVVEDDACLGGDAEVDHG